MGLLNQRDFVYISTAFYADSIPIFYGAKLCWLRLRLCAPLVDMGRWETTWGARRGGSGTGQVDDGGGWYTVAKPTKQGAYSLPRILGLC